VTAICHQLLRALGATGSAGLAQTFSFRPFYPQGNPEFAPYRPSTGDSHGTFALTLPEPLGLPEPGQDQAQRGPSQTTHFPLLPTVAVGPGQDPAPKTSGATAAGSCGVMAEGTCLGSPKEPRSILGHPQLRHQQLHGTSPRPSPAPQQNQTGVEPQRWKSSQMSPSNVTRAGLSQDVGPRRSFPAGKQPTSPP